MSRFIIIIFFISTLLSCTKNEVKDDVIQQQDLKLSKNDSDQFQTNVLTKKQIREKHWDNFENDKTSLGDKIIILKRIITDKINQDNAGKLLKLIAKIHKELNSKNIHGDIRLEKMSPLDLKIRSDGTYKNNLEVMFYSLSFALDNSPLKSSDHNFIHIIHNGLKNGFESINHNVEIKAEFQKIEKGVYIDLLKARVNFLIGLAIKEIADSNELIFENKVNQLIFKPIISRIKSLSITTNGFKDLSSIDKVNLHIEIALDSLQILRELKEEVHLDEQIRNILSHLVTKEGVELDHKVLKFITLLNVLNKELL